MYEKLKVLLLLTEFRTWYIARHTSYSVQLGIEDGLRANGVQCETITSLWLPKALALLEKKKFDQVWIAGRIDIFRETWLDRLSALAPVRVAMLGESLQYSAEEHSIARSLHARHRAMEQRIRYFTHIAACDEADVPDISIRHAKPAMWWPQAVPARFISDDPPKPWLKGAVFLGNPYALRHEALRHPAVKSSLIVPNSPEFATIYPWLFSALQLPALPPFRYATSVNGPRLETYLSRLRYIRERCFEKWLHALQSGCAVVNLPHFVKTYAGRVVEGMAAGRPIISWEIPERPQNKALFEDGSEILLYSKNKPEQLASQIERVLADGALNARLAANARKKIRAFHTSEIRARQILDWISNGQAPRYS